MMAAEIASFLPDALKVLFRHDVARAFRRAAMARMLPVLVQRVAIIESDFLPGRNVAPRGDPNAPALPFRFAVGGNYD